jgi:hypothetical protein
MSESIEHTVTLNASQLRVLAAMRAQARVVELRRRANGIGHVTVLTHSQVEAVTARKTVEMFQTNGILVPHYKNFQKIVLPAGVELPVTEAVSA